VWRPRAAGPALQVGGLRLVVPGRDAAFGRRVAERVGELLAESGPIGPTGGAQIGRLELRVRAGALSEGALAESIVSSVIKALGRA
jgi:hypothetical protein